MTQEAVRWTGKKWKSNSKKLIFSQNDFIKDDVNNKTKNKHKKIIFSQNAFIKDDENYETENKHKNSL